MDVSHNRSGLVNDKDLHEQAHITEVTEEFEVAARKLLSDGDSMNMCSRRGHILWKFGVEMIEELEDIGPAVSVKGGSELTSRHV